MRVSMSITEYGPGTAPSIADHLRRIVEAADETGLDTVWVDDHLIQGAPGLAIDEPMLEAYTTLGFLAASTARVRLGTMVTAATYREPAMLVKSVTTLDVLSRGRAWLGIGAGYLEAEARGMGLPLPPVGERFARLEAILRLALQMWSGDETAFESAHYRLERPVGSPLPATKPHPPILIGGTGERKTLRLVAQYADACNLFDIPDGGSTIRHKLAVLAEHCETVGRPFDAIEKTVGTRLTTGETPDQIAERLAALRALGIDHAVFITSGPWTEELIGTLAATVPAVAGL